MVEKDKKPLENPTFSQSLRKYFVTGLATLFPTAVTIYLLVVIFKFADGLLGRYLRAQIPGLGLLLTVLIILLVGIISSHFFGRVVFLAFEAWFSRFPVVKKIYPPVKQLATFVFSEEEKKERFRRVVMVQYPRTGAYSMAFVTNEYPAGSFGLSFDLLTLLIPTPPSPFTGPVIFVPKDDVIPINVSVEEALTMIISGGIANPSFKQAEASVQKNKQ